MTVRDWVAERTRGAPLPLVAAMLDALDPRVAAESESATAPECLAAASRLLDDLLVQRRFLRADALQLLAVDALATLAFARAAESAASADELLALARAGAAAFSGLSVASV